VQRRKVELASIAYPLGGSQIKWEIDVKASFPHTISKTADFALLSLKRGYYFFATFRAAGRNKFFPIFRN
jgi:hypothetical protein